MNPELLKLYKSALAKEPSPLGREILSQLIENAALAKREDIPLCQDTGLAIFLVEMGEDVKLDGEGLIAAITKGVAASYKEGYLRKSVVGDPIQRKNTGDNTPPIIHVNLVPGDKLNIKMMAKGGGCENTSTLKMLTPADGLEGAKKFVVQAVKDAGGNNCPPITVGVGIGGDFEVCAYLAKKALFREVGSRHPDPFYAKLEEELLTEVNKLGIGPMGLGGRTTALDVHIEAAPCHIVALPVAVNIDCHSHRVKEVSL